MGGAIGNVLKGQWAHCPCASVVYSPGRHHIISGPGDYTIWIWDAETAVGKPLEGHRELCCLLSNTQHTISGCDDYTIQAVVGKPLKGYASGVMSVACSQHIVSGSLDDTIRVGDLFPQVPIQFFSCNTVHVDCYG